MAFHTSTDAWPGCTIRPHVIPRLSDENVIRQTQVALRKVRRERFDSPLHTISACFLFSLPFLIHRNLYGFRSLIFRLA